MLKTCCRALPLLVWSALFAAPTPNETQKFAEARGERVSNVTYDLELRFEKGRDAFQGYVEIAFELSKNDGDLVIDFTGSDVSRVTVGGIMTKGYVFDAGRGGIILKSGILRTGPLKIGIEFTSAYQYTGVGVHQYVDPDTKREYLYSDFQPHKANKALPCFDQPDLRATWRLQTLAPTDWVAISNAPVEKHQLETVDGKEFKRTIFRKTKAFSSYLFNVNLGPYAEYRDDTFRIPLRLFCRQELAEHMDAEAIFDVTKKGFDFFEDYFAIPYPFEKYDQIFVPEYNYGAMENPGSVVHTERSIFRRPPTESRLTNRTDTIFHEQAHMWFGDLVTMKWWNDVWLNESFASYMANLALAATGLGDAVENASGSKRWAFSADQRPSTHPILVDVPDVETAASVFDGITYGKGLAVLQQLDYYLGGTVFRDGVRAYLKKHAWSNTTLDDFTASLETVAGRNLDAWVDSWLRTSDVNTMVLDYQVRDGKIAQARVQQLPGKINPTLRPHANKLGLYYADTNGVPRLKQTFDLRFDKADQPIPALNGLDAPDFIIANQGDNDYIKTVFDSHSQAWLEQHLAKSPDADVRALVWRTWTQMVWDGRMQAATLVKLFMQHMPSETRPGTISMVSNTANTLVISAIPEGKLRIEQQSALAKLGLEQAKKAKKGSDVQFAWLESFIRNARSSHLDFLASLYGNEQHDLFGGIRPDHKAFALIALLRNKYPQATEYWADVQSGKDKSIGRRFRGMIASATPTAAVKKENWEFITQGKTASLSERRMRSFQFYDSYNPELGRPYVDAYFQYLDREIPKKDWESLSRLARSLFPRFQEAAVLPKAEAFLKRTDLDKPLRDLLKDQIYTIKRHQAMRAGSGF